MAEIYNNPGNIQIGQGFAGTVGEYASDREGEGKKPFVEFDSPQMGLRAIYRDLQSKVNTFDGDVAKIISKYAPGNENKTQAYIDNVIKQIGSDTITADNMDAAVRAIVRHENGTNSETTKYYLDDPNLLKEAKELAKHNMPATMTYKKAAETYLPKKEIVSEAPTVKQAPSINPLEQYMRGAETESQYGKGTEKQSNLSNYEKAQNMVAGGNDNIIAGLMQSNYANQNLPNAPQDLERVELPPDQTITPYRETIKEDVTVRPDQIRTTETIDVTAPQYSIGEQQERARRSMMQGNRQDRMEDYKYNSEYQEDYPYLYPRNTGSYALPQQQAAQRMMGGGMGYAQGGSVNQAEGIASLGRGGDSTLVHMQPQEVAGLQQMAQANGTSLTTNPMTGMPEAFNLGGVFRAALPIAAGYFMGPAGMGLGTGAGIAAGAATGAGIAAVSGEDVLAGGLSGGLGGYSGFGASGAFAGAGDAMSATGAATSNMGQQVAAEAAYTGPLSGMTAGTAPAATMGASTPVGLNSAVQGVGQGVTQTSMMTPQTSMNPFATDQLSGSSPIGRGISKIGDNINAMTETEAVEATKQFDMSGKQRGYLGDSKPAVEGSFFNKAKVLGAPAVSLGLGGLEVSDFYDDDIEFSDPRDKYDPYKRLNLNQDTGIKGALASDSGLRLYAEGGPINLNTKTQAPSGRGLNLNTRTQGPSGRGLNLNTGMTGVSPADLAAAALRKTKFKTMPNGQEVPIDFNPGGFQGVMGGMQNAPQSHYRDSSGNWHKGQKPGTFQIGGNNGIGNQFSSITGANYYAQGGAVKGYAEGGYLKGPGDGMSDDIPATINGEQPAALADGEFVVPADVVSHLGNGSSEAGSKQLYAMMDRIRKARTGRESQGKEIKPKKYMPR